MKKAMSLLTATAMAATLLAGCGGSGGSSTTAAETKAAETTAAFDLYRSQQHSRRACCRCSRRGGQGPEHLVLER